MILFSKIASATKLKKCDEKKKKGDGYCDDSNNNADCDFDGGDCCLNLIINQFCSECRCYGSEIYQGLKSRKQNKTNKHTSYVSGKNQRSKLF